MNIETKIEELRKEFNSKLDEILKPKFEVGKWYKSKNTKSDLINKSLIYVVGFNNDDTYNGYGFNYEGKWFNKEMCGNIFTEKLIRTEATPKEVEEALIKEAEKRGYTPNNFKCLLGWDKNKNQKIYNDRNIEFLYEESTNKLWAERCFFLSQCIFDNGKWAKILPKTKNIDEISTKLSYLTTSDVTRYLTENKQDIINALNNL